MHGNRYEVDPALVGATVELIFDPFDLARIEVRYQGRPMGTAHPAKLGRHVHPAAKPEITPTQARPSGIDYLGLVEQRLATQTRRQIAYAELPLPGLDGLELERDPSPAAEPTGNDSPASNGLADGDGLAGQDR